MSTLRSLDDLLIASSRMLDHVASQIVDSPLATKETHIRKIGHALTLIFEIQQEIYKFDPSLEPGYLKRPSPHLGEGGRFGDVIIKATDYEKGGNFKNAIATYQEYIIQNPPEFFATMARNQIERIKKVASLQGNNE